jgi:hypothetical protein
MPALQEIFGDFISWKSLTNFGFSQAQGGLVSTA